MRRQDSLSKFFNFLDNKTFPAFGPTDNVAVFGILC